MLGLITRRCSPDGLTRTQLRDLLHRNQPAHRIEHALATLHRAGRAHRQRIQTDGRPAERWTATAPPAQTDGPPTSPAGRAPARP